ncbi:hypothetical protein ACHAW5_003103 [Stephanodiscus triporus]|uniref:Protein kinase domain-containing protein n=1 Tax=Stephanodiscus triporus TaxID=2934178 RepID=A0ABD3MEM2_9STRA
MLSVNSLHRMLQSDADGITTLGTDDVTVMPQDMLHVDNMIGPTSQRYSLKSCSSISEGDLDMEGNALDAEFLGGVSTDSMTLLESLGDAPTARELDTVAALRVEEFLSTEVSVSDRKKWEGIQQFNKNDLVMGKFLGKGTFSDVFEVFATVAVEAMPTFESWGSDREELDKLIAAKFPQDGGGSDELMGRKVDDLDKESRSPYLLGDLDKIREVDFDPPNQGQAEAKSTESLPQSLIINNGRESEASEQPNQGKAAAEMQEFRPQRLSMGSGRQRGDRGMTGSVCLGEITRRHSSQKQQERKVVLAMKCLRPQIRSDAEQFMIGVEDLVRETTMLASLNHPNIITIHGRAGGFYSRSTRLGDGYFILLDRLQDTLTDRILRWQKQNNKSPSLAQINTACFIADAIAYLHSKNIIFRDLKPDNVGFDSTGVLKLFDLGFATSLDYPTKSQSLCSGSSCGIREPGLLYDRCGTLRYMAPEVGLDLGYSLPSDIYSFGILLWEICALKKPFITVKTPAEFHKVVFGKGVRPKLSKHWSKDLRDTMTKCWSNSACDRPDMWLVRQGLLALQMLVKLCL